MSFLRRGSLRRPGRATRVKTSACGKISRRPPGPSRPAHGDQPVVDQGDLRLGGPHDAPPALPGNGPGALPRCAPVEEGGQAARPGADPAADPCVTGSSRGWPRPGTGIAGMRKSRTPPSDHSGSPPAAGRHHGQRNARAVMRELRRVDAPSRKGSTTRSAPFIRPASGDRPSAEETHPVRDALFTRQLLQAFPVALPGFPAGREIEDQPRGTRPSGGRGPRRPPRPPCPVRNPVNRRRPPACRRGGETSGEGR